MFARSAVHYALGFAVCQACNTTYCGLFLGQSQDVELCMPVEKRRAGENPPVPRRRCGMGRRDSTHRLSRLSGLRTSTAELVATSAPPPPYGHPAPLRTPGPCTDTWPPYRYRDRDLARYGHDATVDARVTGGRPSFDRLPWVQRQGDRTGGLSSRRVQEERGCPALEQAWCHGAIARKHAGSRACRAPRQMDGTEYSRDEQRATARGQPVTDQRAERRSQPLCRPRSARTAGSSPSTHRRPAG